MTLGTVVTNTLNNKKAVVLQTSDTMILVKYTDGHFEMVHKNHLVPD